LNGNAGIYGILLVGVSIGTVVGSVIVGKINSRNYVGKLLYIGVFVLAACIALMGLTNSASVAVGLMLIVGFALAITNLPIQVLVQAKVPGELLGRVLTTLGALVTVAGPVAAIITGTIAASISISLTLLLYGLLMFLTTMIGYFAFKDVREAKY
jgi:MFS family permease